MITDAAAAVAQPPVDPRAAGEPRNPTIGPFLARASK
jgi:hypothetical protein